MRKKEDSERKQAFLQAFSECQTIKEAAQKSGVTVDIVQWWKKKDPEFRQSCQPKHVPKRDELRERKGILRDWLALKLFNLAEVSRVSGISRPHLGALQSGKQISDRAYHAIIESVPEAKEYVLLKVAESIYPRSEWHSFLVMKNANGGVKEVEVFLSRWSNFTIN